MLGKPRILFITKYKDKSNWYEVWKQDLQKQADVIFCGKDYPECKPLSEIIKENNIDFLIVGGLPGKRRSYLRENFNDLDIYKVIMLYDYSIMYIDSEEATIYGSTHYPSYDQFLANNKFDIMFTTNSIVMKELSPFFNVKKTNFSFSEELFPKMEYEKEFDVLSSMATTTRFYGMFRTDLKRFLKSLKNINLIAKNLKFNTYTEYMKKARIFVGAGNKQVTDCVTIKYFESMASGTLLLTTKPKNLDDYGFVENKHLVFYEDFDDLKYKIYYYLENEKERKIIANCAQKYVNENFTNNIVIKKLLDDILVAKVHLSDS